MIDWAGQYTCTWRVFRVNPDTWADSELVGGFSSLKVNADDSELVQTGSMSLLADPDEPVRQEYLRVVLTAEDYQSREREDVCTMLWHSTSGVVSGGMDNRSLSGNSVLYPASREKLPDLSYAPQGVNAAEFAADMLRRVLKAPVEVVGTGFTLVQPMYFKQDSSVLSAARELLDAGGHSIRIDGRGEVWIGPKTSESALEITSSNASLVGSGVKYTSDTSEIPNRLKVYSGTQYVEIVNDELDSIVSHASRGYWDDLVDRSPQRVNGETLEAYGRRRLREESVLKTTYNYQRRWYPGVHPGSIIKSGIRPMVGSLTVSRQMMTCGKDGISVQEEAYMEEALWQ